MKRVAMVVLAGLACPWPAVAQQAPDFSSGEVTIGLEQRSWSSSKASEATTPAGVAAPESRSAKFVEYRDIPQGAVVPFFRFRGKKGEYRWDLAGHDATQKDERFFFRLENEKLRLFGDYVGIPHNFGFGGRSILNPTTPNSWQISDTLQQTFQTALTAALPARNVDYNCQPRSGFTPTPGCVSLLDLVTPTLNAQPPNVDLKLRRGRLDLGLDLTPGGGDLDVALVYFHEKRSGTRAANGTSFGFGNVVETPEPVRYVTQDFGLNASYKGGWGVARAAVHWNDFKNRYDFFTFDNPFRITDATDPAAYLAPSTSSIAGAAFGRMSLPPDNRAFTEMLGATFVVNPRTRLSVDGTLGQWRQDHDPFQPWTTNTALVMPDGTPAATAPLFASKLDGKIHTTALNAFFHTSFARDFGLNARYRRYDLANKTPRYGLTQGYARFDAVWEAIPRITVPYGYTNDLVDVFASYGRGWLGLELGYRFNRMARTFREADHTSENVGRAALDVRKGWFVLRALGELGRRTYDQYDLARSEDASFLSPGLPANQTILRRPDEAKRDLVRIGVQLDLSPSDRYGLFASYTRTKFKYNRDPVACDIPALVAESPSATTAAFFAGQTQFCPGDVQAPLGPIDDRYDSVSVEASYRPTTRVGLYAFYSYEDGDILQNGRQSADNLNFNPADVWTSDTTNKGNTVGAGGDLAIVPQKLTASLFARWQKLDGYKSVHLQPGFSTAIYGASPVLQQCTLAGTTPCDIPNLDDTETTYLYGWLRYQFAKQWAAAFGLGWEDYKIDDAQTNTQINYLPGSFFLQANNRGYHAWVGYLNLTYSF